MSQDPSQHDAHEIPLAHRMINDRIQRWLDIATKTQLAGYGETIPEEVAARKATKSMRHLMLSDFSYALVPKILDDLQRAGLLKESCEEGSDA